ncbi:ArsR/SmtB family transcription factor [Paenibacillus sp. GCM10023252]|uniref:ArsR/SmtB family transcription factor n=1 Tax=Paenibacillus sp. GCM10023252 TaxID=3252649 RepID=UPI00361F04DC
MNKAAEEQCEDSCHGTEMPVHELHQVRLDDQRAADLADMFKAISDPTRVRIVYALLHQELCVHDICEVLGMAQSAISHQLRYLRNVRVVKRRKEGKTVYYSLDDEHVKVVFLQTLKHLEHA